MKFTLHLSKNIIQELSEGLAPTKTDRAIYKVHFRATFCFWFKTNTPGEYQDLVTRYEGAPDGSGCSSCAYDPLGNPLAVTDPRGFTTVYERNELGAEYRRTSPAPYSNQIEKYFDANGNVIREDTQDQQVKYLSEDPTDPNYAKFFPSGDAADGPANVPLKAGEGGEIRRSGRPRRYALREVVNALLYQARTGCSYRALPHDFPPWGVVWDHFRRWRDNGTLERIQSALRSQDRHLTGRDVAPSAAILDSQSVKTTEKGDQKASTRVKK